MTDFGKKILEIISAEGEVVLNKVVQGVWFYNASLLAGGKYRLKLRIDTKSVKISTNNFKHPIVLLPEFGFAACAITQSKSIEFITHLLVGKGIIGFGMSASEYAAFKVSRSHNWIQIEPNYYIHRKTKKIMNSYLEKIVLKRENQMACRMAIKRECIVVKKAKYLKHFLNTYLQLDEVLQIVHAWDDKTRFRPIVLK
jgi:hypothetical protein